MDDRWTNWGAQLARIREAAGYSSPSAVAWEAQTGIDRNKWKRWESGKKPDYDGLLELAAFLGVSMPELVAQVEGEDYAPTGDRTWPEIGAAMTDREFEELHRDVDASEITRRIQILSKLALERLSDP